VKLSINQPPTAFTSSLSAHHLPPSHDAQENSLNSVLKSEQPPRIGFRWHSAADVGRWLTGLALALALELIRTHKE